MASRSLARTRHETVEPADVDLARRSRHRARDPDPRRGDGRGRRPRFAGALARLGGLAVLNLEGVQARYDDPDAVLERIAAAPDDEVPALLAEAYAAPIRED